MATKTFLSRVMKMSWEIQRNKRSTRDHALTAAWLILRHEDVIIFFLKQQLHPIKRTKRAAQNQISLFNPITFKP